MMGASEGFTVFERLQAQGFQFEMRAAPVIFSGDAALFEAVACHLRVLCVLKFDTHQKAPNDTQWNPKIRGRQRIFSGWLTE
jgi:hypothetical protein